MVLPITNKAAKHVRPAQGGAVPGSWPPDDNMIAATGSDVTAVNHEFFRAEPRLPRFFVKDGGVFNEFVPTVRWMQIHLDDAGVGCDLDMIEPMVVRRRRAFDDNWQL